MNSFFYRLLGYSLFILSTTSSLGQIDTAYVRTYGGPYYEEGKQIIECSDGGYAVIGTTGSDQPNNTNFYLLRLDEDLNCMWNRNYGGVGVEWGNSIVEDDNGNFLLCGYTSSYGEGGYDILVYKVDSQGDVIWQKTYGGSDWDFGYKIIAHPSEGFLICGKTYSYGNGRSDGYLLHINSDGNVIDEWTYGGEGDDELVDMLLLNSSDVVICGNTENSNGHYALVYRITVETGNILWQQIISDSSDESFGNAICLFNNLICIAGAITRDGSKYGFTSGIDDNGNLSFLNDNSITGIPSELMSLQSFNDNLLTVGKMYIPDYSNFAPVVYKLNEVGFYLEGMVYGTDNLELDVFGEFHSCILKGNIILATGRNAFFENNDNRLLVLFYGREIIQNQNIGSESGDCFTTELVNYLSSLENHDGPYFIYNSLGQLILISNVERVEDGLTLIEPGLYIIRSRDGRVSKKIFKN